MRDRAGAGPMLDDARQARVTASSPAAPVLAFKLAEPTRAIAVDGAPVVIDGPRGGIELVRVLQPAAERQIGFSGDGAWLATAGDDHVLRVWSSGLPPGA